MPQLKPLSVWIRTYQVGFGDCFLMSVRYQDKKQKHVLIDFGTTELPEGVKRGPHMARVAEDIKKRTGGKLTAIIATHRHQDHIFGFARTKATRNSGGIIFDLKPDLVCQPWTEHPDIAVDATGALSPQVGTHAMAGLARSLTSMQKVSKAYVQEAKDNASYLNVLGGRLREELKFIGDDNISNRSAVENLMEMGRNGKAEYLHAGKTTELAKLLGCEVLVLGPPTVEQHAGVKKQRSTHSGEYWHLAAHAADVRDLSGREGRPLFTPRPKPHGSFPAEARWLINRAKRLRGNQMLSIVRMMDKALNNTSLILLFKIGSKSFLFPGDAQWENWEFALSNPAWMKLLAYVDVYKVGHHGSLNATPKKLWEEFAKRMKKDDPRSEQRMKSLMSTMAGKHGHAVDRTEVPRESLVRELKRETEHFTTQELEVTDLYHDTEVDVS